MWSKKAILSSLSKCSVWRTDSASVGFVPIVVSFVALSQCHHHHHLRPLVPVGYRPTPSIESQPEKKDRKLPSARRVPHLEHSISKTRYFSWDYGIQLSKLLNIPSRTIPPSFTPWHSKPKRSSPLPHSIPVSCTARKQLLISITTPKTNK